ncbi:MAG: tetrahydromethanopterin S-methyltransferase subunit F [Methanotrichaceae archaeon]|jgi:tetrahydromethanopterin S-methyltransferase subunit F
MAEEKEAIYGQGIPTVADPSAHDMSMIQDVLDDYKWKAQLLARETKLSSGVLATVSMGFAIGFLIAVIMMIGPFFILKGGI